jgi:hypothetical protein
MKWFKVTLNIENRFLVLSNKFIDPDRKKLSYGVMKNKNNGFVYFIADAVGVVTTAKMMINV